VYLKIKISGITPESADLTIDNRSQPWYKGTSIFQRKRGGELGSLSRKFQILRYPVTVIGEIRHKQPLGNWEG